MTVLRVDLRGGHGTVDTRAAAHPTVRDAVDRAQGCEKPRFLIVDRAADLVGHRLHYEELLAYGAVPAICLAVGAPEPGQGAPGGPPESGDPSGDSSGDSSGWLLARPQPLGPPSVGVLWVPDPAYGTGGQDRGGPGEERREEAVRPLAELLEEPDVFDAVLRALGEVSDGVAVPAPHLLEHDLAEGARTRAWRQALEGLTGEEAPVTPSRAATREDPVPAELALLVGEDVPKALRDRTWCRPGGEADERRRACEAALRAARGVYEQIRSPLAPLRGTARRAGLPDRLEELARRLGAYRETAAAALREGDGVRLLPEQRAQLDRRGIDLPDVPEASRENVGPGLRRYTETLLGAGLPLRSTASRLAALSDRSAPAGSAARLARLDEVCPRGGIDAPAAPAPFTLRGANRWEDAVPAFVAALLAGLWQGPGWVTGPLAGLAAAWLTLFMLRHRPNRPAAGRPDGGGSSSAGTELVAGLVGGLAGALAGQQLGLPAWAGPAALLLAALALVLLGMRRWTAAVDEWWAGADPEFGAGAVTELQALLSETALRDWLLGEARLHCADGARAVSMVLRNIADEVEAHGKAYTEHGTPGEAAAARQAADDTSRVRQPDGAWEFWDWEPEAPATAAGAGDAGPPPPAPAPDVQEEPREAVEPPWLERETGDGGRALVDTLVGDLADGVLQIVAPCWSALERDPATVARMRPVPRVRELLDTESACLTRDGAAAPPPYVRTRERRPGTAELLGVSADRVARVLASGEENTPLRPLCSAGTKRMLSRDPGGARSVRFAPEAARRGAPHDLLEESYWTGAGDDVVWTGAGRFAGVLRLVPLRGGIVRTVRSAGGPST